MKKACKNCKWLIYDSDFELNYCAYDRMHAMQFLNLKLILIKDIENHCEKWQKVSNEE